MDIPSGNLLHNYGKWLYIEIVDFSIEYGENTWLPTGEPLHNSALNHHVSLVIPPFQWPFSIANFSLAEGMYYEQINIRIYIYI